MNAVITGGTKGMGRAIAEIFATNGFDIAVAARTQSDLDEMQADFAARFPNVALLAFRADLSKKEAVSDFAKAVLAHWTSVDVLVNNAGIFKQGNLLTEPEGMLEQLLEVNLLCAYHLTRALAPSMVAAGRGHIFNICSISSQEALPNNGAYTISKFALLGFSKSLRLDLRESGVKVTAILPGSTFTDSWKGVPVDPQRLIAAEDIAKAVYHAWSLGPSAVLEELVLRPQLGDL